MESEDPRGRGRPSIAVVMAAGLAGLALGYGIYSTWRGEDGSGAGSAAHRPAADAAEPSAPAEHGAHAKATAQESVGAAARPTFDIVRIAKDRQAVLAGRGPAKAQITVLDGDTPIAEVQADQNGEWVALPDRPLAGGTRALRLSALLPDGNRIASAAPLVVLVPEVGTAQGAAPSAITPTVVSLASRPGEASRVLRRGGATETLSLAAIDYDEAGDMVFSGTAAPGATVRVYLNNRLLGETRAQGGDWRIVATDEIAAGAYTLRIDQLGADGRVSGRLEVPFARASASQLASIGPGDRVVIQPGNNLWRIARRAYGRGILYTVIYRANADQIRDPDLIYPGQIFTLPKTEG